MKKLQVSAFTVDGKSSGTITRPCGSLSAMQVYVELSGELEAAEAPGPFNVPIWIGEKHLFWDKTLILSYVTFTGAAGIDLTASGRFTITCSPTCSLTPFGTPAPFSMKFPSWWFRGRPTWAVRIAHSTWFIIARIILWLQPRFKNATNSVYQVDGNHMVLTPAYNDNSWLPFFRWWYSPLKITVQCGDQGDG